ncbi:unnamed protein product [Discosporangium mesarthrocarpum]
MPPKTVTQLLRRASLRKRARIESVADYEDVKLKPKPPVVTVGIDDKIAALERDLQQASESSNSSGISSDSEAETYGSDDSSGERPSKLVSSLSKERIEPLPLHLLPTPGCGMPKDRKKSKRSSPTPPTSGLEMAVKDLLANYEARSSERVPFYCRICKFQGCSVEELEAHKREPLHEVAVKKERKISNCSLCKKQFTSPPQLKEHLSGKAHREKLLAAMSKQGKWVPGKGLPQRGASETPGYRGRAVGSLGGHERNGRMGIRWRGGSHEGRGRYGKARGRGWC